MLVQMVQMVHVSVNGANGFAAWWKVSLAVFVQLGIGMRACVYAACHW